MMIFGHRDCDGDTVEVLVDTGDYQEDLVFLYSNSSGSRAGGVRFDRQTVLRLRVAIDEYLYPAPEPDAEEGWKS